MVVSGTALRAAAAAAGRQHVLPRCAARLCASSRCATTTTAAPPTARTLSSILASGISRHHSRRAAFSTTAARPEQQQQSVPPIPSSPPPPSPQQAESDHHQQQKQQQSRRRTRRSVLFGAAFLLLGSTLGSLTRTALAPSGVPEPGTDEDAHLLASIAERAAQLPLHKKLSADPAWRSWAAYDSFTTAATGDAAGAPQAVTTKALSGPSLTSRSMSGSRGLAYQRIFHNPATCEVVSIVYLGGSIAGWPGVVHGGAIATVLDETLGRCAVRLFPARTGVTANLELDYKQPTRSEGFYVIRTRPMDHDGDGAGKGGKSDRKRWVAGTLERLGATST